MTHAVYSPATWLDQFFTDFDRAVVAGGVAKRAFHPPVDIAEEKEEFVLRAELPGVAKENLKVEVKERRLTLSGEKKNAWEGRVGEAPRGEYRYAETGHGAFSRTFELPRNVQGDAIKAEFKDGVLTLRIPKVQEALPRTISIE
jgi:HSP20 family protein